MDSTSKNLNNPGMPSAGAVRRLDRSQHLLDLKRPLSPEQSAPLAKVSPRRMFWQRVLDERIYLRDLRNPRLSNRPRGWRDFPNKDAKTVKQALWMMTVTFFKEHPLSDLTVLTFVHLVAVVVWKMAIWPITRENQYLEEKTENALHISWRIAPAWPSRVLSFAVVGLVLAIGLTVGPQAWQLGSTGISQAITASKSGASRLLLAGEAVASGDLYQAKGAFDTAVSDFDDAKSGLGKLGLILAKGAAMLPIDSPVTAAGPLLTAGDELAKAGSILASALAALESDKPAMAKLDAFRNGLSDALPHLDRATEEIGRIRISSLPAEYQEQISIVQEKLPSLTADAHRALKAIGLLRWAMGDDVTRRFLFIFQNNSELRPTGGFIGSFAIIDVDRGEVKKIEVPGGGSYDLQGSLLSRLISPQPLHLVRAGWEFQDANWFADYPTSAKKLTWFLEKSGGPTVDGVIAVDVTLMERLLEVVGPIEMPEYGKTITSGNFWFETQRQVEIDYDREENRPKQFIADMAPKLIEKISGADKPTLLQLASVVDDSFSKKDILIWFRNEDAEREAIALDWSGQIKPSEGDYLSIVHTNIAGQKTDFMMRDQVDHSTQVMIDGSATVTLTLRRTHTGMRDAIFTGVRNVDYARFYVPAGALLLEAKGFNSPDPKLFKIPESDRQPDADVLAIESTATMNRESEVRTFAESGKTVFGGWIQTDPGETETITLVYRLPPGTIRMTDSAGLGDSLRKIVGDRPDGPMIAYSLLVQKQPGANPIEFTSRLDLPLGFRPIWQSPIRESDDRGRWYSQFNLDRDTVLDAIATSGEKTL